MASTQLESSYVARTTRLVKPRSELFVFDRGGPAQVPCGDILAGVQDIGCRYIGPFPRRHDGQVNCRRLSCEAAMSGAEGSEQGHSLASLYWLSYFQSCCLIGSPGGRGQRSLLWWILRDSIPCSCGVLDCCFRLCLHFLFFSHGLLARRRLRALLRFRRGGFLRGLDGRFFCTWGAP